MAHDVLRAPVSGRPDDGGLVVTGEFGEMNEQRARELVLENLREVRYPATRAGVEADARRQRMPPQLLALLARMPEREYVSVEDVADEVVEPHPGRG